MATPAVETTLDSAELKQRIERFHAVRDNILTQVHEVIVGQEDVLEQILIALVCRRPLPDHRAARHGEDADGPHHRANAGPGLQAHPVHPGSDAVRHHRHRHHRGGSDHRPPPLDLRSGTHLRQHPAGRRNQSHAAQDAVGAARSHAGASPARCAATTTRCRRRSSCWPRRTRSSWKAPIPCPKRSSTASCSTPCSTT